MGVRILHGRDEAVMYCSTTDWAFGPVFNEDKEHDATERVESFLRWFTRRWPGSDPREVTDQELESRYSMWLLQEEAQWAEEESVKDDD